MREYLIIQLKELIKCELLDKEYAVDLLETYDEESEDTSELTAYDKIQQDIKLILEGELK
jgi:hypothetical protein